ncbi:MAG: hypothetical protein N2738_01945 [Thermodesulfovibrionales bacterium]|nr:hypothetical protein [Thermodesulfovibrionales bacterium]
MKKFFFFLLVVTLILSCGKKEVKKETLEGRTAKEAVSLVESLRMAYVKKDRQELERLTTAQGLKTVLHHIGSFDSIDLTFTPVWIEIETNKTTVNVSWKAKWIVSDKSFEDRGMAIFELKGQPFKVDKILRANPFTMP